MRYLIAIIHTALLVFGQLITIPLLQWYKRTFLEPNTDITSIYVLLCIITFGMIILTCIKWVCAINDKDFKDL